MACVLTAIGRPFRLLLICRCSMGERQPCTFRLNKSNLSSYAGWVPSQSYYAFALAAGCWGGAAYGYETTSKTIFDCLISKDTHTLQNASFYVSASANFGIWGFLPVTDGFFIQDLPSKQLAEGKVNGIRLLAGVSRCSSHSGCKNLIADVI